MVIWKPVFVLLYTVSRGTLFCLLPYFRKSVCSHPLLGFFPPLLAVCFFQELTIVFHLLLRFGLSD
ncbi:hypothetical protein DFJ73DRAFT_829659, partial [Zopfochytrium polystomum]